MNNNGRALVYLGSHNEVDQISAIVYKLGERGNIAVDVVLEPSVSPDDYRIRAINRYDTVSICNRGTTNSQLSTADRVFELVKDIGRRMPTDVPEKVYNRFVQSSDQLSIPNQFSNNRYDVVAFDWSHAKGERTSHFASNDDITTIVLPHGDSPFINNIETQKSFNRFIQRKNTYFTRHVAQNEIGYRTYQEFLKHDYLTFPNNLTADRMPQDTPENQIKVFGSPRYNSEWLDVLSEFQPQDSIHTDAEINTVFFLRVDNYFVSESEVKNTIELLNQFDDVRTIVKEHPRDRLLPPNVSDELENVTIVKDEISSASLIEWGDVFLSLGTTITFEPIMRQKPVLAIEYAHANYSVVSDYFSNADLRTKEDLYHSIHAFLKDGIQDFYIEREHNKFVEEMISPTENAVLDSWAAFIESQCQ
jgi:hypothetical protein